VVSSMRQEGMRTMPPRFFFKRRGKWVGFGPCLGPCWWASAGLLRPGVAGKLLLHFFSLFSFSSYFLFLNSVFNSILNAFLFCRYFLFELIQGLVQWLLHHLLIGRRYFIFDYISYMWAYSKYQLSMIIGVL
jgi:hypothetical protein